MTSKNTEPLLAEDDNRYVMFPIQDKSIWNMYKKSVDCFWRAEEIDLSKDKASWDKMSDEEKYFVKMILAFFAASDGIVLENLGMRFMSEVQLSEARAFYGFQIMMENIHSEVYSLLIDTYVEKQVEKDKLFNALDNFPCIKKKADWAIKWINDKRSSFRYTSCGICLCRRNFLFRCILFYLLAQETRYDAWFMFSNELISRDEALHTEFAVLLHSKLNRKMNKSRLVEMVKEAVEIEKEFIISALPCRLIGMNSTLMSEYIEFVADRLIVQLGGDKVYHAQNPFDFMELISVEGKTNFFEKRVGEYALANKEKPGDGSIFNMEAAF